MAALTSRARSRTWPSSAAVMVGLAVLPLALSDSGYRFAVAVGMVYAIAAVGLDIFSGYVGILSITNFGFVAIGAYTSVVLATQYGWNLWLTLPAAVLAAGLVALAVGSVIVRLAHLGAALATFFLAFVIVIMLEGNLLSRWTSSADGLRVPQLTLGGLRLDRGLGLYAVAWVLLVLVLVASHRYVDSRAGMTMRLVKRSDVVAASLGVNAYLVKLTAFVFSAMTAGAAGFVFAQAIAFVTPLNFGGMEGVVLLAMAVVGGFGSLTGPVVGAVAFRLLQEFAHVAGGAREIIFAVLLLLSLILLPNGLYGVLEAVGRRVRRGQVLAGDGSLDASPVPATARAPAQSDQGVALALDDVAVQFDGIRALDGVTLSVPRNAIYALMGPNGAGKTTLLNCISGIQAHSGTVEIEGERLAQPDPRRVRALGVTRTFQHPSLVEDLTVVENVELGHYGTAPSWPLADALPTSAALRRHRRDREVAKAALDIVGFAPERRDVLAGDLTLAEQKLADVARAIAGRPRLLLMDEPTAGLEASEMAALAEVIRRVRDESSVTVLVIAHHVGFLRMIADRAAVLDFGRVIAEGTPDEVVALHTVATVFLGEQHVG